MIERQKRMIIKQHSEKERERERERREREQMGKQRDGETEIWKKELRRNKYMERWRSRER